MLPLFFYAVCSFLMMVSAVLCMVFMDDLSIFLWSACAQVEMYGKL